MYFIQLNGAVSFSVIIRVSPLSRVCLLPLPMIRMMPIIEMATCTSTASAPRTNNDPRTTGHIGADTSGTIATVSVASPTMVSVDADTAGRMTTSFMVMTQRGSMNERAAVPRSTIRLKRWNVSLLSIYSSREKTFVYGVRIWSRS